MEVLSEHGCFGGVQGYYRHDSKECGLPMAFSVYRPPQAEVGPVPVLLFLAGLTCTHETFAIKAGAQRLAAEHGLMLLAPDTSPRGAGIDGEDTDWDLGTGAAFYLDAAQSPWDAHYRMESWLLQELIPLVRGGFPADPERLGICGHSMGGHGALTLALRHPDRFASVSAFAPICAPSRCPWGEKAFSAYLGDDRDLWQAHDASALMQAAGTPRFDTILIDQGLDDQFLAEQLHPDAFQQACQGAGQGLELRMHAGYDHGYFFIQSFIADHLAHHARKLVS